MDLDQPARAATELQRAAALRPRWRRVSSYESLLELAASAQLRGALNESAVLHRRASAAAPNSERPDVLMSEARSNVRAGDVTEAVARYAALEKNTLGTEPRSRCAALLAHAVLTIGTQPFPARRLFSDARICVEAAGDLDGLAQVDYERALYDRSGRGELLQQRRALSIAQSTGNIEQQILAGALLSRDLLENGEDEDAYIAFSRTMQITDEHGLQFLTARLLNERAQYYFDKGDFLQASNFGELAWSVSRSAGMPRTYATCAIRNAKLTIRMGLTIQTREGLADARERLRQYPNAALAAQITELENLAKQTRGRPELR